MASVTLFLIWEERSFLDSPWRYTLPLIMLFLSFMMVSEVKYPSFKTLDMKARRPFSKLVVAVVLIGAIVILRDLILPIILPLFMTAYLVYGFFRPYISRRMRREIEEEDDEDDEETT